MTTFFRIFLILFVLVSSTLLTSCSLRIKSAPASDISPKTANSKLLKSLLGGDPEGLVFVEKVFTRETLQRIVAQPEITNVRFIKLIRPASLTVVPEYRILDIAPEGPYRILGFEPGDIVIACHGRILESPVQFFRYVKALPYLDNPSFDVVRKNQNFRIIIKVLDQSDGSASSTMPDNKDSQKMLDGVK
ncbi:MAG: hypothetical protein NZO16_07980 [Deltaproteobacteria bacterium]|nr:hypothetical protein [Deltaproteobacteria bacterium]